MTMTTNILKKKKTTPNKATVKKAPKETKATPNKAAVKTVPKEIKAK